LKIFNQAIESDPLNALPYLSLADFFALRGRAAEAEEILLRGLERLPDHLSLHEALLSVYQATGNREGAQSERRRIETINTVR
jgi:tetratricopeptide (TPR) repeat protein